VAELEARFRELVCSLATVMFVVISNLVKYVENATGKLLLLEFM
jgi:hypothetical protein